MTVVTSRRHALSGDVRVLIWLVVGHFLHVGIATFDLRMEAIAKFDFKASADDELNFKKGTIVKV